LSSPTALLLLHSFLTRRSSDLILRQRCPRCRKGAIYRCSLFRGWLSMFERCPVCDLKFEREQGYFVGAMYVSYSRAIPPYLLLSSEEHTAERQSPDYLLCLLTV